MSSRARAPRSTRARARARHLLPADVPRPAVPLLLVLPALAAGAALGACSRGESRPVAADTTVGPSAPRHPRPELAVVDPVTGPYVARVVSGGGRITGSVTLAGEAPRDTSVALDSTVRRACRGPSLVDRTVVRRGDRLGGAAVWLADIRTGKPLPLRRRHEVRLTRCAFQPRVQAVPTGGTLHVRSSDPLLTRTRLARQPVGEVLRVVETNDEGQVVPVEGVLDAPGVLELRGERQPWLRAYVLVVDHPYVATSDAGGAFTLDDVPPGSYRLMAWHERLGRVEQRVTVGAGEGVEVKVVMGGAEGGSAIGGAP